MTRLEPRAFRFKPLIARKIDKLAQIACITKTQVVENAIELYYQHKIAESNTPSKGKIRIIESYNTVIYTPEREEK